MHGGGMVIGDRRFAVELFLPYVAEGKAAVVSVEYRLAPEHPDPALVEDCYAGLVWTAKNATAIGVDPQRLIIAGGSAGEVAWQQARHSSRVTGHSLPLLTRCWSARCSTTASMTPAAGCWTARVLGPQRQPFRVDRAAGRTQGRSRRVALRRAGRGRRISAGLPRTYLDCGSADTFRDAVLRYAERLSQAGVSVDLHLWGGGFHGFDGMAPHAAISRASNATRDEFLRRALEA
ncbi:alpha/beta hydrolase [Streptomyces griseorubiginosus]